MSITMKILKRLVICHWLKPLISHEAFSDQFAFIPLPGRGCTTALTCIYGNIVKSLDCGNWVNTIMIDLSKAFDRVSPVAIVDALFSLGASQECLAWVFNFMSDRHVAVKFNNTISSFISHSTGTPQGSLISPILFTCLLHTLKPISSRSKFFKYADDLTIIFSSKNPNASQQIQAEIANIEEWCRSKQMKINAQKSALIHMPGRKKPAVPSVSIENNPLAIVDSARLLGIELSCDIKWSRNVDLCVKKASRLFYHLLRLSKNRVNKNTMLNFYLIFVRPHLSYAFPVMCNLTQFNLKKLLKAEKRFLNIVGLQPKESLKEFLNRMCEQLAQNVLKNENHPIQQLLNKRHVSNTRSRKKVSVPVGHNSYYAQSFIKYFYNSAA